MSHWRGRDDFDVESFDDDTDDDFTDDDTITTATMHTDNNLARDNHSRPSQFIREDITRTDGCDCKAGFWTTMRWTLQLFIAIILFAVESNYIAPWVIPS